MARRIFSMALLLLGIGAGGALGGLLTLHTDPLVGTLLIPARGADPGIPFVWSGEALSPVGVQVRGLDLVASVLAVFAVCLLAMSVGSAALSEVLRSSMERGWRAIRGLIGASPQRIFRDAAGEAVAHVLIGSVAGFVLSRAGSLTLMDSWPEDVSANTPTTSLPIAFAVIGAVIVIVAIMLPVARVFRQGWLGDALAPSARSGRLGGGENVPTMIAAAQLLLALTLIYPAGVITTAALESVAARGSVESPLDELLLFDVDGAHIALGERSEHYARFLERVEGLPNVVSAALASRGALGGRGVLDHVIAPGGLIPLVTRAEHHAVSSRWFDTLGVAVAGESPRSDAVVLNATAAGFFGWVGPAGAGPSSLPLRLGGAAGRDASAVGLLREDLPVMAPGPGHLYRLVAFDGVASRVPPVVYLSFDQFPPERAELVVRHMVDQELPPEFEAQVVVAANDSDLTLVGATPVADRFRAQAAPVRWISAVVAIFAAIALGLALLGVSGVFRVVVNRRTAELGLRRAMGSSRIRIVGVVMRELVVPAAAAAWLGLGVAIAGANSLTALLTDARQFDVRVYFASVVLLVGAAAVGAAVPTLRALRGPPSVTMRLGEGVAGGELM